MLARKFLVCVVKYIRSIARALSLKSLDITVYVDGQFQIEYLFYPAASWVDTGAVHWVHEHSPWPSLQKFYL